MFSLCFYALGAQGVIRACERSRSASKRECAAFFKQIRFHTVQTGSQKQSNQLLNLKYERKQLIRRQQQTFNLILAIYHGCVIF